jgi:hypothetical protein
MSEFETNNGHVQALIPLKLKPNIHEACASITGDETVLYGHYTMEYLLPKGDKLRIIANHNQKTAQLILLTHDASLIQQLPGARPSSLIANAISQINSYILRSSHYVKPLTKPQEEKAQLAKNCVLALEALLEKERTLCSDDYEGQEYLRNQVLDIIEQCRDNNRLLSLSLTVSEGMLGSILYDAKKTASQFSFNRYYKVSSEDQMDFNNLNSEEDTPPCFIWDSELHIGYDNNQLDDAIRTVCSHYKIKPSETLNAIPANRFERLEAFILKLWQDTKNWVTYLALKVKAHHQTESTLSKNGITITQITPYYAFQGVHQKAYSNLEDLKKDLGEDQQHFKENDQYYPLPDGQDLYTLTQLSRQHLYLPERIGLGIKAFVTQVPKFFKYLYASLKQFVTHDLKDELINHIHQNHQTVVIEDSINNSENKQPEVSCSLRAVLKECGYHLSNGQTLETFVAETLKENNYVIARSNHPQSPPPYTNPFHRVLSVFRQFAGIFIDTGEKNPIIGTFAAAAYLYGAGAILAPGPLVTLFTKLHLEGLIPGIQFTEKFAGFISHGLLSKAITASVLYWEGVVIGGDLDKFFANAITLVKDNPAEVAIVTALALSLGYGLSKAIPPLGREMGSFPLTNYFTLGAKGGTAVYDTIMHPGDDWFLGGIKWLLRGVIIVAKILLAPWIEGLYYGFSDGFINGFAKSGMLLKKSGIQTFAATIDFLLAITTIPFIEIFALFIHIPFRGVTHLFAKTLGSLGNLTSLGEVLIHFATRPATNQFIHDFRKSPLYGFTYPFGIFSANPYKNALIILLNIVVLLPFEAVKNIIVLPLTDALSLMVHIVLFIANPSTRIISKASGFIISNFGILWDSSVGVPLIFCAIKVTQAANWADRMTRIIKQQLLSNIEIARHRLYQEAFSDEDVALHTTLKDSDYYMNNPKRIIHMNNPKRIIQDSPVLMQNLLQLTKDLESVSEEIPIIKNLYEQDIGITNSINNDLNEFNLNMSNL